MKGAFIPRALIFWISLPTGAAALPIGWNQTLSSHFEVLHEAAFIPPGFILDLENIHSRLQRDLAMFAPWMAKERIKIYLYRNKDSYLRGQFNPPSWSDGIAQYERKLLALYVHKDRLKTLEVAGHEMTHLLFESYWGERKRVPPIWLNEGLAMLKEGSPSQRTRDSTWHQALILLTPDNVLPMPRFVALAPQKLARKKEVTLWYIQAYSLVHFLYHSHTRLQFFNFCRLLRDDESLNKALWKAYRYPSLEQLEVAWKNSLKLPQQAPYTGVKGSGGASRNVQEDLRQKKLKSVEFNGFKFHSFAEPKDKGRGK